MSCQILRDIVKHVHSWETDTVYSHNSYQVLRAFGLEAEEVQETLAYPVHDISSVSTHFKNNVSRVYSGLVFYKLIDTTLHSSNSKIQRTTPLPMTFDKFDNAVSRLGRWDAVSVI